MGIKESQYADHLNEGGPRYFLLLDKKQLVLANVLGTEPIRWLAEVLGELGYAVQIFGALRGTELHPQDENAANSPVPAEFPRAVGPLTAILATSPAFDER